MKIIHLLREKGAKVIYNDPYVGEAKIAEETLISMDITDGLLSSCDCVVIATDHSCYEYKYIADNAKLIFDTRGVTRGLDCDNIIRLGEQRMRPDDRPVSDTVEAHFLG